MPRARRRRSSASQSVDPARYVGGLLAWQGAAWLLLAAVGLGVWIGTLPSGLMLGSASAARLWKCAELLAIALGAGLGSAEASMACRLRGGCGLVRAAAAALRALTVAAGLVAGAVGVLLVGSVLELIVLNGPLPACGHTWLCGQRPLHLIPGGACAHCDAAARTRPAPTRRPGPQPAVHRAAARRQFTAGSPTGSVWL